MELPTTCCIRERTSQLTSKHQSKMNRTTDKRGLVLAGADRVMRELLNIFKDDPQFAEPIENAMNASICKNLQ